MLIFLLNINIFFSIPLPTSQVPNQGSYAGISQDSVNEGPTSGRRGKDYERKIKDRRFRNAILFARTKIIQGLMSLDDEEELEDDVEEEVKAKCPDRASKSKIYYLKKAIRDGLLEKF